MNSDRNSSDVLVIDASLILRLTIENPTKPIVENYFNRWYEAKFSFIAPTLWVYEITSTVNKLVHFGDLEEEAGKMAIEQIMQTHVELIHPTESLAKSAFDWTRKLKRASAYDSFYLALADEYNAPFWTADGNLLRSTNVEWIHLGTE